MPECDSPEACLNWPDPCGSATECAERHGTTSPLRDAVIERLPEAARERIVRVRAVQAADAKGRAAKAAKNFTTNEYGMRVWTGGLIPCVVHIIKRVGPRGARYAFCQPRPKFGSVVAASTLRDRDRICPDCLAAIVADAEAPTPPCTRASGHHFREAETTTRTGEKSPLDQGPGWVEVYRDRCRYCPVVRVRDLHDSIVQYEEVTD